MPDNLTVTGYLNLKNTLITELPDSLSVGQDIDLRFSDIKRLPDNFTVHGVLYLNNTDITELPNNLTVEKIIFLSYTNITKLPDNLKVGESVHLQNTDITELPDSFIVAGNLVLGETHIKKLPNNLIVGGCLDISDTDITELPDNLTVGDNLILRNTKIKELPDNLTVSGNIFLNDTKITKFPDNLKVYGHIKMNNKIYIPNNDLSKEEKNKVVFWKRDGVEYIKADGIFSVIEAHHDNVYKVHKLFQGDRTFYLVTDGEGHWAHGDTLAEAKSDLIYKINDRDTSAYKNLSLDDTLSVEEAIAAYRTITGACLTGTRYFIENKLPSPHKDKYTIREIIKLTNGEYGGEKFAKFFEKNSK